MFHGVKACAKRLPASTHANFMGMAFYMAFYMVRLTEKVVINSVHLIKAAGVSLCQLTKLVMVEDMLCSTDP